MSGAFRPHPGSEPFVEPEIVPPRHGDEITEPLVGHLVRDHFINALLGCTPMNLQDQITAPFRSR